MKPLKGKQVWKPCAEVAERGCKFVYIPHEKAYANGGDSDYEDLRAFVEDSLPEAFKIVNTLREDAVVVGSNGYYDVCLTSVDWATVLVVMVREDAPECAKDRLSYVSDSVFRKAAALYKVMIGSGKRFVIRK